MIKKNRFLVFLSTVLFFCSSFSTTYLNTIYGDFTIQEPVLCELLDCPSFNRLAGINQYGVNAYVHQKKPYTRYTHSLGVFVLLRKFGATEQEQIAGLLHDVSHTVFSHAGGWIFNNDLKKADSHQDDIHMWYLQQTEIVEILAKYGYSIESVHHKNKQFKMLEKELPDLCADRLEYTLYGGYIEDLLTREDIKRLLSDLRCHKDEWFFVEQSSARKFAEVSCYLTEKVFGSPWDRLVIEWTASALRRALQIKLINERDIYFSVDEVIWKQLCKSKDMQIKRDIQRIKNHQSMYRIVDEKKAESFLTSKCRCINPLVRKNGFLFRLNKLDEQFDNEYIRIKKLCASGYPISFTKQYKAVQ